jgi:DNA-binding GntR family transcriptional regulator
VRFAKDFSGPIYKQRGLFISCRRISVRLCHANRREGLRLADFVFGNQLRRLAELAEVTSRPDDRESCVRFIEADTAFHMSIARLSRNQMIVQAVSEARSQMERIMFAAIDINYFGEAPGREQRDILKAVQDRDSERARQRMYEHIVQSKDKVLGLTGFAPLQPQSGFVT